MIHERERLALRLEPGNHRLRIHARLDHFYGDLTFDRRLLLSKVGNAAASLAQFAEQPIRADSIDAVQCAEVASSLTKVVAALPKASSQTCQSLDQIWFGGAGAFEICAALSIWQSQCGGK